MMPQVQPPTERKRAIPITKDENKLLWFIRCQARKCPEPIRILVTITKERIIWELIEASN